MNLVSRTANPVSNDGTDRFHEHFIVILSLYETRKYMILSHFPEKSAIDIFEVL